MKNNKFKYWIKEYIDYMQYQRGFRPNTVEFRQKLLKRFQKFLAGRPLSTELINKFIKNCGKRNLSKITINSYIRDIKCFCKFLHQEGKTPVNHGYFVKRLKVAPNPPEILSLKEIEAIIKSPLKYKIKRVKQTYHFATELLAKTGMRRNELCSLDCGDFDFNENTIYIRFGKGGRKRYVHLPLDMKQSLKRWFEKRKVSPNTPVFLSRDYNRMQGNTFRFELKRRAEAAGIKKRVYPHLFRHSFVTEMLNQDICVAKVSALVGHANPTVTLNVYSHIKNDQVIKAGQRYPLIKKKEKIIEEKEEKPVREIIYVTIPQSEPLAANFRDYHDSPIKNHYHLRPILDDKLSN